MTALCTDLSKALERHRGAVLESLRRAVAPAPADDDRHVGQQLETAIVLLAIMLRREGADAADRQFGAWLKGGLRAKIPPG
ncbi:MAG TPA: hypothetical protein VEH76_12705 [Methylocystis sp.]|nr:hypothetical protein [Methylocystis sp.]